MSRTMKRFTGLLNRNKSSSDSIPQSSTSNAYPPDSVEANAVKSILSFCESPLHSDGEVIYLPTIVESAESSPSAAIACVQQIRRLLSKEYARKPSVQYKAIMLMRILSDNPGPSFTRGFDEKFVKTVRELLKTSKDAQTQQMLRENLDALEVNRRNDEGIQGLLQMWRKEKDYTASLSQTQNRRTQGPQQGMMGQQGGMDQQQHRSRPDTLPQPHELASRVEEAKNTAKILLQLIASTPPDGLLSNELIREFSERCSAAQRSMQTYISCDSPPPDDNTLQTLIETNEQLSLASSRYQRAVLAARRAVGSSSSPHPGSAGNGRPTSVSPPPQEQSSNLFRQSQQSPAGVGGSALPSNNQPTNHFGSLSSTSYSPPPGPPPQQVRSLLDREAQRAPLASIRSSPDASNDPFADPVDQSSDPAPLAIEPTNYGPLLNSPSSPSHAQNHVSPKRQDDSRIDASEQAYHNHSGGQGQSDHFTPESTSSARGPRPGADILSNSGVTPSYLGRQSSALAGMTMHGGADGASFHRPDAHELDSHSKVGRTQPQPIDSSEDDGYAGYDVSPISMRSPVSRGAAVGAAESRHF